MPPGNEVTTRADGSLTATNANATTTPSGEQGQTTEQSTQAAKAGTALTKDAQSVLSKVVEQATTMLASMKTLVDGATIVEAEGEMSVADLAKAMGECAGLLEDSSYALLNVNEPAPEGAAEPPPAPETTGKRFEVRRAKRVLDEAKLDTMKGDLVQKYGTKMRKERLERFRQAMSLLGGIMEELTAAAAKEAAAKEAAAKEAAAKTEAAKTETAKSAPSGEVSKLEGTITALEKQVKELSVQLADVRKRGTASNSIAVESIEKREEPVSWPSDLNQPLGKGDVKKGEFFGEE